MKMHELNARNAVVDVLWEQRRLAETALSLGEKRLARFIFFDCHKDSSPEQPTSPEPPAAPPP